MSFLEVVFLYLAQITLQCLVYFSLGIVVVAALNLVIDFDFIEEGSRWGSKIYGMVWIPDF